MEKNVLNQVELQEYEEFRSFLTSYFLREFNKEDITVILANLIVCYMQGLDFSEVIDLDTDLAKAVSISYMLTLHEYNDKESD